MLLLVGYSDYKDDNFLITKNTSIIVRRVPATRAKTLLLLAAPKYCFGPCSCWLNSVASLYAHDCGHSCACENKTYGFSFLLFAVLFDVRPSDDDPFVDVLPLHIYWHTSSPLLMMDLLPALHRWRS